MQGKSIIVDESGASKVKVEKGRDGTLKFMPLQKTGEPAATFRCKSDEAFLILASGALQIVSDQGHFLARCSGKKVWLVYEVPFLELSDSCLVSEEAYRSALEQALA